MRHARVAGMLAVALLSGCSTGQPAAPSRPNIVLILADDMGYETVTANGGESFDTPHLDRLARDGMRFNHAYAQPFCTPSRVKLLTGRSNWRNYATRGVLIEGEVTFAQLLREQGYATAVAGKWQLDRRRGLPSRLHGQTPQAAGFDESCLWADKPSDEDLAGPAGEPRARPAMPRYWNPRVVKNGETVPTSAGDYGPDIFASCVIEFIGRNRAGPFLVYYPMVLPHAPFNEPPEIPGLPRRTEGRNNFHHMVGYADHLVGRIRRTLEELGIAKDTILLFTSDNGSPRAVESRFEGRLWKGGKASTTDAGTRVPLLVWWEGVTKPGTVRNDLVDLSDLLPTFAEASGSELPEGLEIDGRSFLPLLASQPYTPRKWIFMHYDRAPQFQRRVQWPRVRFARTRQFKLYDDGRLYDLSDDREERQPLEQESETSEAAAARVTLQDVLDAVPSPRFGQWRDGSPLN